MINPLLILLIVLATLLAAMVWWSPKGATWLAGHLYARATALAAARRVYREQYDELRPRPVANALLQAWSDYVRSNCL